GDEHRDHEAEIRLDVGCRRDRLRREAVDEREHPAEDEEVAERDPEQEQRRAADDQRQRQLLLMLVQAGRDKGPRLVQDIRQRDQVRDKAFLVAHPGLFSGGLASAAASTDLLSSSAVLASSVLTEVSISLAAWCIESRILRSSSSSISRLMSAFTSAT